MSHSGWALFWEKNFAIAKSSTKIDPLELLVNSELGKKSNSTDIYNGALGMYGNIKHALNTSDQILLTNSFDWFTSLKASVQTGRSVSSTNAEQHRRELAADDFACENGEHHYCSSYSRSKDQLF